MYKVKVNDAHNFELSAENGVFRLEGEALHLDIQELAGGHLHLIHEHKSYRAEIVSQNPDGKAVTVKVNGRLYEVAVEDHYDRLLKAMGLNAAAGKHALEIKAPMPGLVLSINVSEGQEIKKGDSLLVLEAMKMENMLKATSDGRVKKIFAGKGDKVEKGQVLIEFTA